jgi:hypothetical protein
MQVSIPYSVDLTRESEWNRHPEHDHLYWVIRTHFKLRERQVDDVARMGNRLMIVESPAGVHQEYVRSLTTELTSVQLHESFAQRMYQDESMQCFASSLATGLGTHFGGRLAAEVKSECSRTLTETFQESYRHQAVVTQRVQETYDMRYTVKPSMTERLVGVAMYQRYAIDIKLTWVDYLEVVYRRTTLGLRKKRVKTPPVTNRVHPNWEKFNLPLATVYYWKPLPQSAVIMPARQYRNEVDDPESVDICPPASTRQTVCPKPDVPTLYQVSNAAFPLRWIERRGDWTEDELKRIEDEEAKQTAWWWEYGPGRTDSASTTNGARRR